MNKHYHLNSKINCQNETDGEGLLKVIQKVSLKTSASICVDTEYIALYTESVDTFRLVNIAWGQAIYCLCCGCDVDSGENVIVDYDIT